jgi:hypothetical protein
MMEETMENLVIEAGASSPYIRFDPADGILEIGGESYPENSYEFYTPVLAWIDAYLPAAKGTVAFIVHLSYLNTSSTKCMIDILDRLEAAFSSGKDVRVEWYYDADNDRAKDTVAEFKEDFTMPFSLVARHD